MFALQSIEKYVKTYPETPCIIVIFQHILKNIIIISLVVYVPVWGL